MCIFSYSNLFALCLLRLLIVFIFPPLNVAHFVFIPIVSHSLKHGIEYSYMNCTYFDWISAFDSDRCEMSRRIETITLLVEQISSTVFPRRRMQRKKNKRFVPSWIAHGEERIRWKTLRNGEERAKLIEFTSARTIYFFVIFLYLALLFFTRQHLLLFGRIIKLLFSWAPFCAILI